MIDRIKKAIQKANKQALMSRSNDKLYKFYCERVRQLNCKLSSYEE